VQQQRPIEAPPLAELCVFVALRNLRHRCQNI
jgi:hypothetical protein